jgi:excisionase family DNA binding protein
VTETPGRPHRFLTIEQAAEELNVSQPQIRAMLRTGELHGFQLGGRGLWRIGRVDIESFIDTAYKQTAARIAAGEPRNEQTAAE